MWMAAVAFLILAAGWTTPSLAAAPTVYDFRLTQGAAALPSIRAYADIVGTGEVPVKGLQKDNLKARLGPKAVSVSRIVPFEDANEGIAYVLLVDVSKSLSAAQFSQMQSTLAAFADAMSDRDQAALITFGSEVRLLQDFSPNRGKIKELLAGLRPLAEDTAFYGGIDKAISVARAGGADVPRRRVVITLTDGVNDLTGGASKGDISSRLSTDPVPLYLIGFFQGRPTPEEESAIGVMKDFAAQSGGRYYDGRGGSWNGIYFAIMRSIRNAFVIEMDAAGIRSEGAVFPLEISLEAANRTWTSKLQLTVPAGGTASPAESAAAAEKSPSAQKPADGRSETVFWISGAAAVAVLLAGVLWVLRRRRKPGPQPEFAAPLPRLPADGPAGGPIECGNRGAACSGVLIRLTRIHEGPPPRQFELEIVDRVVLGCDPAVSHLVFEHDSGISPAHCEIYFDAGCLYLQDLGSGNGTFLNGAPVTARQRIEEQDVLKIGRTEMRITFPYNG